MSKSEFLNNLKNTADKRKERRKASNDKRDQKKSAEWMQQNVKDLAADTKLITPKQYVTSVRGKGKKMSDLSVTQNKPEPRTLNKTFGKKIIHPKHEPKPEPKKYVTGIKGKGKKMKDISTTTDKPSSPIYRKNISQRPNTKQGDAEADLDFIVRQANPNVKGVKVPSFNQKVPSNVAKNKTKKLKNIIQTKPSIKRVSKDKVRIGGMYMYAYDAKTKLKMRYYDEFPLILLVEPAEGGHYGLNLHYVPPAIREIILNELMDIALKSDSELGYMKLSWSTLKKLSTQTSWQHCFKRYLSSHLKSSFYEVTPDSWEYAINLPHAAFVSYTKVKGSRVKVSNTTVWGDA